jgi:hypothetical protein
MAKNSSRRTFPEQCRKAWATNGRIPYLSALFFNAFPLLAGGRHPADPALHRRPVRRRLFLLIFPRATTTTVTNPSGRIGMIGARLDVLVVPVGVSGLDKVLHHTWKMAKPGPGRIRFGAPLRLQGDDYAALAKQVEDAVRLLVQ